MVKIDIKKIEESYKSFYDEKKINKKTKKWKKFYSDFRKGKVIEHKMQIHPQVVKLLEKEKKKPKIRSTEMTFNGKKYYRSSGVWDTKAEAKEAQEKYKTRLNKSAILDKRKNGYFFWLRDKK